MPALRVLYDISSLGVGHFATHGRAGSHRVDRQLAGLLAASPDCELLFCANESSLAWHGCVDYLRDHPLLAHVPLVAPPTSPLARGLRSVIVSAHRRLKVQRAGRALPGLVRSGGALVDARVHRSVADASPPVDVLHSSTTPLPPPSGRDRGPRRFVTIFDLRAGRPDACPHEIEHEQAQIASVRDGDGIITSSEATRSELCDRGVAPAGRIAVVPLAADPAVFRPNGAGASEDAVDAAIRRSVGVPDAPYVLMLDAFHPRKNVGRAIDAFAAMVQQQRIGDLVLVLAGGPARPTDPAAIEARHPSLRGRVVPTGYVCDAALAALYRGALCFVYPSLYEGFGLPPLEAMQCGTPVITGNTSSLPEVVGDAGLMVDPTDTDAFAAAMLARWQDEAGRALARARGLARASRFSWARTLAATLDAYRAHSG
jgi:glycosyltransferase involved in cell wall biosynthesis